MKYLYIIFAAVCIVSVFFFFGLYSSRQPPPGDAAITVNGHAISAATLGNQSSGGAGSGYHQQDRAEMLQTVITRELLIQEAKRQKIDQEESFRLSLKNYYENSLIKILLDRKDSELQVHVEPAEIEAYLRLVGSRVTFTRLNTVPSSPAEAAKAKGETTTAMFDNLADSIKLLIASLQPGQFATRFDTGSDVFAVRLDSIEPATDATAQLPEGDYVATQLKEFKKEQLLNQWLTQLSTQAKITIHDNDTGK